MRKKARFQTGWASLLAGLVAVSAGGRAHGDPGNDAPAQALFEEAKALIEAKAFPPACRKLELSMKLAPAPGTLLWLAACYEGEGKTATAWVAFNEALSRARQDGRADREAAARDHMAQLLPRLSKIALRVAPPAQHDGLEVRLDDGLVASALFGVEVPVDPGVHTVAVAAKGKKGWQKQVMVTEPGTVNVDVPKLDDDLAAATPQAPRPPSSPHVSPVESDVSGLGGRRGAALIVGGVGALGLAASAVFGLMSLAKHSEADGHCRGPKNDVCDATGVGLADDSITMGNVSTVAFVVGATALVTGGLLWLTAPRRPAVRGATQRIEMVPTVGFGLAALTLRGSF